MDQICQDYRDAPGLASLAMHKRWFSQKIGVIKQEACLLKSLLHIDFRKTVSHRYCCDFLKAASPSVLGIAFRGDIQDALDPYTFQCLSIFLLQWLGS